MASLPHSVITALEAFAAPHRKQAVHDLAVDPTGPAEDSLAELISSVDWVDMAVAHPLGPDRSDPEGMRRLLQAMGAEGRCAVLSSTGSEDDRDLGGALDGALHQDGGTLVVCRPGPLAFLITGKGEHWLLSDREIPQLTGPIGIVQQ